MLLCPAPLRNLIHGSKTRSTAIVPGSPGESENTPKHSASNGFYRGKIDDSVERDPDDTEEQPNLSPYDGNGSEPKQEGASQSDGLKTVTWHESKVSQLEKFYRGKIKEEPTAIAKNKGKLYRGKIESGNTGPINFQPSAPLSVTVNPLMMMTSNYHRLLRAS